MLSKDIEGLAEMFHEYADAGTTAAMHPKYIGTLARTLDDWAAQAKALENTPVDESLKQPQSNVILGPFEPRGGAA